MPPVRFKPTISAGERPQTYGLDRAATGTGNIYVYVYEISIFLLFLEVRYLIPELPIKFQQLSFLNVTNVQNTDKTLEFCEAIKYGISCNINVMVYSKVTYAFSCKSS
jgi:hypothetical protein